MIQVWWFILAGGLRLTVWLVSYLLRDLWIVRTVISELICDIL